jgi:hypothetical protein
VKIFICISLTRQTTVRRQSPSEGVHSMPASRIRCDRAGCYPLKIFSSHFTNLKATYSFYCFLHGTLYTMHLFIFFSLAISALAQTSLGSRSSVIPRAKIAPLSSVIDLLGATSGSTALDALKSLHPVQPLRRAILNRRFLTHSSVNCIGSQYSESHINALFSFGGPNTTVNLCANAKISIFAPIQFTAKNQTLVTLEAPNDSTRALSGSSPVLIPN